MALFVHATGVFINGQGVLIVGSSGVGKSALALELIEQGGFLIADDMTFLTAQNEKLYATADEKWQGCIEARGLGIVQNMPFKNPAEINYAIELVDEKTQRMPEKIEEKTYCGVRVPSFKIYKDEKKLSTLVKIAGKIVSKEVSLLPLSQNTEK